MASDNIKEKNSQEENLNESNLSKKDAFKQELKEWVYVVVFAAVISLVINTLVLVNAKVPSSSMETTVMAGDRLYGYRLSYLTKDPERLDVVIFKAPDDVETLYIKRVIGIPGDTIEIKDGLVYLNGSDTPLEESSYVHVNPEGDFGPYVVPEDSYFMMGDNRNNSLDSRYWVNTYCPRKNIVGKAIFRYWPNISKVN